MARVCHLFLTLCLAARAAASAAASDETCQADGSCEAAQGSAMLQAKSQLKKVAVRANRTRTRMRGKRAVAKQQRSKVYEYNGKLMTTGDGVWFAGPFGSCTSACDPPIKEREVKCVDFWTGADTHACGHIDPPETTMECGCGDHAGVVCIDTAPEKGCPAAAEEHTPGLPGSMSSLHFSFVGCFGLADDDSSDGEFLDETCLTYSGEGKCRSGLPFFTNDTAKTPEACSAFCLSKGLDISGLVNEEACRCGASAVNAEVWHESDPVSKLEFDGDLPDVDGDACPLEVYRYSGYYNLGGIPVGLLKPMVAHTAYIDGIVKGKKKDPLEEEDKKGMKENLLQKNGAPWDKPCYPENCGPGRGPWTERHDYGPSGDPSFEDKFEEYTWVPYYYTGAIDDLRKQSWGTAVKTWYSETCIVLYEVAAQPTAGITVDVVDEGSCYVAGMGTGASTVNLGWCKDAAHIGNMVHEIGHALGMKHEQARMDAQQEYHGKGPYLNIHWDAISDGWKSQYVGNEEEYLGSNDQGGSDPYSGYAPYDFGSIMHYPGGDAFDTIPSYKEAFVGQRSALAHSDIMQIWDMYQCVLKPGFTIAPSPAPAAVITVTGACEQNGFSMNGDYAGQGTTASGADWYKMPGGLALYFDPSCNGGGSSPRWVLDNDDPDVTASSDLDGDGGCTYWAKVNVASNSVTYPGHITWRVYCPSGGGWSSKDLDIGPWTEPVPTPEPPDPTPAPPTPAPTIPACIGNAATWDSGWGGCSTYAPGTANGPYCKMDTSGGLYASEVCADCTFCDAPSGPTAAPAPTPDPNTCKGDAGSWDAGYGGCDTYGAGTVNNGYCDSDSSGGFTASECCGECGKCTVPASESTPATPAPTAPSYSWSLKKANKWCKDKSGYLKKVTEEECAAKCAEKKNCNLFSYRPLAKGGKKPGECRLSKKCKKMKKKKNWYTYKMD